MFMRKLQNKLRRDGLLNGQMELKAPGIKPGFIKTGVDISPLSATQRKVIV